MSKVLNQLQQLSLPSDQYIVIGSGILDALGLRQSNDLDLLVSADLYQQLEALGWDKESTPKGQKLTYGPEVEAWIDWDNQDYQAWLKDTVTIENVKFVSLARLRAWKATRALPKDLTDIQHIDNYLANH